MPFTLVDLRKNDNHTKIQVVLMVEMGKPPLTPFKSLSLGGQRKFNERLNTYIKSFPDNEEEWDAKIQEDFNTACLEELFVPSFRPENQFVAILNTDIIRLRREGEEDQD